MTQFITQKDLIRESMKRINYKVAMKLQIPRTIAPISLSYELKNSDFVLNFIEEIIKKQ